MALKYRNILFVLSLVIAASVSFGYYNSLPDCVECVVFRLSAPASSGVRLGSCSNIEQRIVGNKAENIRSTQADVDGWSMYVVEDESKPGVIAMSISKEPNVANLFFFPRMNSPEDSVEIHSSQIKVNRKSNPVQGWSPIGDRVLLKTKCLDFGWLTDRTIEVPVTIILKGRTAQVWHKDGAVFF